MATEEQIRAALPHLPFTGMTAQHVAAALDAAAFAAPAEAVDPRQVVTSGKGTTVTSTAPPGSEFTIQPDWSAYGGVTEIVADQHVSRVTVNTWRSKTTFPPVVTEINGQPVYDLRAVRAWRTDPASTAATDLDTVRTSSPEAVPLLDDGTPGEP